MCEHTGVHKWMEAPVETRGFVVRQLWATGHKHWKPNSGPLKNNLYSCYWAISLAHNGLLLVDCNVNVPGNFYFSVSSLVCYSQKYLMILCISVLSTVTFALSLIILLILVLSFFFMDRAENFSILLEKKPTFTNSTYFSLLSSSLCFHSHLSPCPWGLDSYIKAHFPPSVVLTAVRLPLGVMLLHSLCFKMWSLYFSLPQDSSQLPSSSNQFLVSSCCGQKWEIHFLDVLSLTCSHPHKWSACNRRLCILLLSEQLCVCVSIPSGLTLFKSAVSFLTFHSRNEGGKGTKLLYCSLFFLCFISQPSKCWGHRHVPPHPASLECLVSFCCIPGS